MGQKSSRRRRDPWADSPPKPSRRQVYPTVSQRTASDRNARPAYSTQQSRSQPVPALNQRTTPVAKKPYQQGNQRQYPQTPPVPEITPSEAEWDKLARLKGFVQKGNILSKVEILAGQQNYSYDSLFAKYMGPELTAVRIVEPWLAKRFQLHNLTRLLECCVINAPSLRVVQVCTKPEMETEDFGIYMKEMKMEMNERKIILVFEFDSTLAEHSRFIVLDTGYVLHLDRGLHIYQFYKQQQTYFLGQFDLRLRRCHTTRINVDVFDA